MEMKIKIFLTTVIITVLAVPALADPPRSHRKHDSKASRFHAPGHRLNRLPGGHVRITVGSFAYFYASGVFYNESSGSYVAVAAPIGAMIRALPPRHHVVHIRHRPYYLVNNTYYAWESSAGGYVVVAGPTLPPPSDLAVANVDYNVFIYPKDEQDEDQQSKDRFECHTWAARKSGFDPSVPKSTAADASPFDYRRAMTACLVARDYSVA